MKSNNVLKLLNCTRQTLTKYVKEGKIKVKEQDNGYYDYNDEDVYNILSKGVRTNCIYSQLKYSNEYLCYNNYYNLLNDLLEYKIKKLIVYGYEIKDIQTLKFLCDKYGCTLEVI